MREPSNYRLADWAIRLLDWLSAEYDRDAIVGDFAETYSCIASDEGLARARFWYVGQLLKSLPAFVHQRFYWGSHIQAVYVDETYLQAFDLSLVPGRNFMGFESDKLGTILNETGVKAFGFASSQDALGSRLVFDNEGTNYLTVIGVVEDFNWMTVKEEVGAIGFLTNRSEGPFSIKVSGSNMETTLASIQAAFEKLYPASPYESYFADDYFNRQYQEEKNASMLFGVFTVLALFVACLGLIGLAAYMVSQRTKEIGIRKIMGASAGAITTLLLSGFSRLLAVALVIAIPISYVCLRFWLDAYASRIDLTVSLFLLPSLSVFTLALLTVSYHSLRAAWSKPVKTLRY